MMREIPRAAVQRFCKRTKSGEICANGFGIVVIDESNRKVYDGGDWRAPRPRERLAWPPYNGLVYLHVCESEYGFHVVGWDYK